MKERRESIVNQPVVRILLIWIIQTIGLLFMAWIQRDVQIDSVGEAVAAVAVIGLLNALLWPILSRILLPFAVFTAGLLFLVLNGFIVWLASEIVPGFTIATIGAAVITSLGITAINVIFSTLLTIDDDASYYRNVIRKRMRRRAEVVETDVPGIFFLEIDGLARPVLEKAINLGHAPTMKRWLENGDHKLVSWETDLSSQTSASQAGILHGNNREIPAFRWYDRERQMIVASSNPDEVARLEKEHSDGNGLLVDNGASRGNLMSGDAPNVMNTASVIKDLSRFHTSDFYAYFADPYNFSRTLLLFFWDIVLERYRFSRARSKDIQPRLDKHHRNFKYALVRGVTTTILRELNIYTLIGDMYSGTPSAYATFVGYDEVAHHSGVESKDAFDALFKIDQQFARLEQAARQAPRPYHLVILSDHGQSGGATFLQRYGKSLDGLVQELAEEFRVEGFQEASEGFGHVNAFLTDTITNDKSSSTRNLAGRLKGFFSKNGSPAEQDGRLEDREDQGEKADYEPPQIVVMASGNLGLVYGTQLGRRATLEEINEFYPGLLEGLAGHEGVGFIMVSSSEHGPVIISSDGRNYLAEGRVEGEDPLAGFGPRAVEHLLREDSFSNCPDILVNSFYNADTNEVAAFEELIGCHGGMGGYQTQPFLLFPASWDLLENELIGAASVYRQLKNWLNQSKTAEVS
ncbi:MAG: phage holin family protein [Candidatus Promineifilaceae bacterium]